MENTTVLWLSQEVILGAGSVMGGKPFLLLTVLVLTECIMYKGQVSQEFKTVPKVGNSF